MGKHNNSNAESYLLCRQSLQNLIHVCRARSKEVALASLQSIMLHEEKTVIEVVGDKDEESLSSFVAILCLVE